MEVYVLDPLPPKLRAALLAGTPDGLQLVEVFQLPVVGAVVVPAGPMYDFCALAELTKNVSTNAAARQLALRRT